MHSPLPWRVQPHDNYMPEGYGEPIEIVAADNQVVACNTAFYPTGITADNAALIVACVNATAPTVAAQQCGLPEGLDATDMDMIRRGDMLGPVLGARVASLIQSQAARIAELEAGLLMARKWMPAGHRNGLTVTENMERDAVDAILNGERKG